MATEPQFFSAEFAVLHVPVLALFGTMLGSFFNVCIYRIPHGVPLTYPSSHCYRCGQTVRWFDNVPLVSYWVLGGRCRDCGAPFSARYFFVELLTMTLLMGATLKLGYSLAIVPVWIFTSLLIVGSFTDIDHWIIPDGITLGGLAAGLALAAIPPIAHAPGNPLAPGPGSLLLELVGPLLPAWLPPGWYPFLNSVAGAAAGWGVLWSVGVLGELIFRKEAMGFGDVKLFGMFGAFCGLSSVLPILMIASIVGSVVGIAGIVLRKMTREAEETDPALASSKLEPEEREQLLAAHPLEPKEHEVVAAALEKPGVVGKPRHHLPFGPSLAVAAYVVYLWGPELTRWYLEMMESIQGAWL
jgi:leader peptidase (prepilin peptidase)/N-methyltransferase